MSNYDTKIVKLSGNRTATIWESGRARFSEERGAEEEKAKRRQDQTKKGAAGSTAASVQRRKITIVTGDEYQAVTDAERALIDGGAEIYQRGLRLVRPITVDALAADGKHTKVGQLLPLNSDFALDILSGYTAWFRWSPSKGTESRISPPFEIAKMLLARSGYWRFPRVSGVIMTPTLRPDGSLLIRPGYDESTGLLLMNPPPLPPISMEPTKDEAIAALTLLKSLLVDFPFVDESSHSVALSTLITPVVRIACGTAPAHAGTAPAAGTGKSYLYNIATAICIGDRCPTMTVARSESETEKRLGSAIIAGQPIISLDNVDVPLSGAFLCQAISEKMVQVRKLGFSEQLTYPNNWVVFINGNNLELRGDLTRRVLMAEVDADVERPELRTFSGNPFERVLADRGRFIAAALTIVLAYRAAGSPDRLAPLASFEVWSDLVRSALVWLDEADPVRTMEKVRAKDSELRTMRQIIVGMSKQFGLGEKNGKFSHEIIQAVMSPEAILNSKPSEPNMLREGLRAVAGHREITSLILGVWLSSKVNRVVDGLRLRSRLDSHLGNNRWWVEKGEEEDI